MESRKMTVMDSSAGRRCRCRQREQTVDTVQGGWGDELREEHEMDFYLLTFSDRG